MADTLLLGLRVALSLAVVLAVLWFVARQLNGRTAATRRVPITVLGRQNLSRRAGMAVVEVGGRTLVVGVTDTGVRLLTELDDGDLLTALPGEAGGADADLPGDAASNSGGSATAAIGLTSAAGSGSSAGSNSGTAASSSITSGLSTTANSGTTSGSSTAANSGTTFADVLAAEGTGHRAAPSRRAMQARRRQPVQPLSSGSSGPLAGSVLDKNTWAAAFATFGSRQNRSGTR
ncbi:MAG: FliO/MopB family protein [Georgenia sp.]